MRISEKQLYAVIEHHHAVMLLLDPDSGVIVDANRAAARFYGYTALELCGKRITDISQLPPARLAAELACAKTEGLNRSISRHKLANNELRTVEIYTSPVNVTNRILLFSILHDITEHKQCEEELEINVVSLRELNTTLKVILQQVEKSRDDIQTATIDNIEELVLPNLDRLKNSPLSTNQLSILQSIESNIMDISSSFLQKLRIIHHKLTAREIDVAALLRTGKSTKEMAEQLNVSTKTIEFHRNKLRGKLGLKNKKVNLRSHLLNLK